MKIKSPLEVEILMHYHCTNTPFPREDAPAVKEAIEKFCELGILIGHTDGKIEANREATDCFVEKLMNIELPINKWL